MTCIVDTSSINLSVAAGQLSADLIVDPGAGLSPNPLIVNAAGVYVIGSDGWIPLPTSLAFSSVDGHIFVVTTSADLRSFINPGDKIRLVQSGVPAYFFVHAIAAATITLYGGTDYAVAALPISLPYFSKSKSPVGFTLDPNKWSETLTDSSDRLQATPGAGTWYNPGSLTLVHPIGVWNTEWRGALYMDRTNANTGNVRASLSTSNAAESDPDLSAGFTVGETGASTQAVMVTVGSRKDLVIAVKTSYFLVCTSSGGGNNLGFMGSTISRSIARARCAYLT